MASERIERVRVVNRNKFALLDRHDGLPYTFLPGVAQVIPPDVAQHLFAFPAEPEVMHAHMSRRWGWNRPEHVVCDDEGVMLWQKWCRNIEVATDYYEVRRVQRDDKEPIPAEEAEDRTEPLETHRSEAPAPKRAVMTRRRGALKGKQARRGPRRPAGTPRPPAREAPVPLTMGETMPFDAPATTETEG